MPKNELTALLARTDEPTEFIARGTKPERYSDAQLARLAEVPSLTRLAFSHQTWTSFPESLARVPKLDTLEIVGCNALPSLAGLEKLTGLRSLTLVGHVPDPMRELARLAELPDLARLTLGGAFVTEPLDPATVPSLIEIDLRGEMRGAADHYDVYAKIPTLRRLIHTCDRTIDVQHQISKLGQLEHLAVRAHHARLPPQIGKLVRLRTLEARNLETVPDEIASLVELVELRLDGPFESIPNIASLVDLEVLHLPAHRAVYVPDPVFALAKIRDFVGHHAARAQLTIVKPSQDEVDDAFREQTTATFGPVAKLAVELTKLARAPKLRTLIVNHASLPPEIGKLEHLATLTVTARKFPVELAHCPALTTIYWRGRVVPDASAYVVLGSLPALRELHFAGIREVDLAALGRAFTASSLDLLDLVGIEDIAFGSIAAIPRLREVLIVEELAGELAPHLPPGKWSRSKERAGITSLKRRVTSRGAR